MRLVRLALIFSTPVFLLLEACAHGPAVYKPEVGGPGVMSSKGGIIYSIPPEEQNLKMKLVSLGIGKDKVLRVRMYLIRKVDPATATFAYVNKDDFTLTLPRSNTEIHPNKIATGQPGNKTPNGAALVSPTPTHVDLAGPSRQAVDLYFQLGDEAGYDLPHFSLNWKVHYLHGTQNSVESQTARFDRIEGRKLNNDDLDLYGFRSDGNYQDDIGSPFEDF